VESSNAPNPRGSGVVRHTARERAWEPAGGGEADTTEAIDRHIQRHFGPITFVWHELVSDLVHIDVHVVEPSPARPYFTLVTSGMSDRPMTVPADAGSSPYAELIMCLPADWPMTGEAFRDENAYWPIRLLKMVARLPHEYDTWIAAWHSVPNGDPAEPYAPDTPFVGVLVAPMIKCGSDAHTITTDAGKQISLLALVPLHPAEVRLKLTDGTDALINALDRVTASEVFDPTRPSSV
jgi:hypothetical protein